MSEPARGKDVPDGPPDGTESMTAAEEAGQVAYGAEDSSGETGPIGVESSSG